ncbi:MAG TPA: sigma-70 family RNA polymerase sigma factor [Polyangiaceae bacterium]
MILAVLIVLGTALAAAAAPQLAPALFEDLVAKDAKLRKVLFNVLRFRVPAREDAEDLLQNTYVSAMVRQRERAGWVHGGPPPLVAYMVRIAFGELLNWRRSRKRKATEPTDDVDAFASVKPTIEQAAAEREEIDFLFDSIRAELLGGADERLLVGILDNLGMTRAELAELLGCTPEQIKNLRDRITRTGKKVVAEMRSREQAS